MSDKIFSDNILDSIYKCLKFEEYSDDEEFETANTTMDSLDDSEQLDTIFDDPKNHLCSDQTKLLQELVERFNFPISDSGIYNGYIVTPIIGRPLCIKNINDESLWCFANDDTGINYFLNGRRGFLYSHYVFFEKIVNNFLLSVHSS